MSIILADEHQINLILMDKHQMDREILDVQMKMRWKYEYQNNKWIWTEGHQMNIK